jgi:imidazolonepropionase-like amidohydrolase
LLASKQVSVITGPDLVRTVERAEVNLPLVLSVRGVPVAFQSQATTGARHLPLAVSYAVHHGLGADDALQSLTSGAAKLMGLENVGTLATGKDADLVVLSGPPFELSTRVLAVMVDGEWVYQSED